MIAAKMSTKAWLLLIAVSLIWGSSFILMKKGLIAFSADQVAALRVFMASLVFIPFAVRRIKLISRQNLIFLILVGFLGTGIPPFLFTEAQTAINSTTAGTLNSFTPVVALIIGSLFFRMKLTIYNIGGVLTGFTGACLLILFRAGAGFDPNFHGLYVILATVCYASSTFLLKHKLQQLQPFDITVLAFLLIGPPAGVHLLVTDIMTPFQQGSQVWFSFGAILILALVGTALATFLFNTLVKESTAIFAQSVTYLMPIVALLWGLVDREDLAMTDYLGVILIIAGVYLINLRKQ